MKRFKGQRYNIGALLLDCGTRYIEDDSLVLVFKNRPNMERMQGELENPDTRRSIQQTVQEVTGTLYNLNLRLADSRTLVRALPGDTWCGRPRTWERA